MALFYAYLKSAYHESQFGYLIAFVSRETADEWWRMISSPPSPYAAVVERLSPQFYVQKDPRNYNVVSFFGQTESLPDARRLHKKMFITLLDNSHKRFPIMIPPEVIADHISGKWYFIRSRLDPWSHWYFCTDGACLVCGDVNCVAIHVSSEYRTKFCIRVRPGNNFEVPEDFVMIGKDEISMMAPTDYTIHIDDTGKLKATKGYQGRIDMLFSDLKNRFIARAEKQVSGEVWERIVPVERGLGEAWELLD